MEISLRKTTGNTTDRHSEKRKGVAVLLLMSVPVYLLGFFFNYVPIWGWIMAFIDFSPGIPIFQSAFVGLHNFVRLFDAGSNFLIAMRNTLVLSFLGMLVLPASAIFALLITEVKSNAYKKAVQVITTFPNFISWIIVYSLFFYFLSVDDGFVNILLLKLGLIDQPVRFLSDPAYSWPLMTLVNFWKGLGYSAIMFIAAIAGIDQELYHAADVDGAGRFGKVVHITVPGILPTFAVLLILTIGQLLNLGFEQYYSFQNPMTIEKLEILDTYVYRTGLANMDFSFATAVGIFKSVVSCLLLLAANGVFKKVMGRSII